MRTFTLLVVALFVACGGVDTPSEVLAEKELSELVSKGTEDKAELIAFKKTDGLAKNENEVDLYIMDFNGQIKILKETWSEIHKSLNTKTNESGFLFLPEKKPFDAFKYYEQLNENDIINIEGSVEFVKKESGWKIKSLYIKPLKK